MVRGVCEKDCAAWRTYWGSAWSSRSENKQEVDRGCLLEYGGPCIPGQGTMSLKLKLSLMSSPKPSLLSPGLPAAGRCWSLLEHGSIADLGSGGGDPQKATGCLEGPGKQESRSRLPHSGVTDQECKGARRPRLSLSQSVWSSPVPVGCPSRWALNQRARLSPGHGRHTAWTLANAAAQ